MIFIVLNKRAFIPHPLLEVHNHTGLNVHNNDRRVEDVKREFHYFRLIVIVTNTIELSGHLKYLMTN